MRRQFSIIVCMALAVLGTGSCVLVDDSLDFDKELSLDMRLGGDGLYVPVGTLDTVWMDSLLQIDTDNAALRCLDNGVLGIGMTGQVDGLKYSLDPIEEKIRYASIPSFSHEFDVPVISQTCVSASCRVSDSTELNIDVAADDAIVSISAASFRQPAGLGVELTFTGIPSSADTIRLNGFEIMLPDYMNISYDDSDSRVTYDSVGHILTFNGELDDNERNGLSVGGLTVNGLNFKTNPIVKLQSETRFVVDNGKVRISGVFDIKGRSLTLADLADLTIGFNVSVDEFFIDAVKGVVDPEITNVNQSVAMAFGDDLDFLFDRKNNLKLSDMQLALNLNYILPADIDIDLGLLSKDSGGSVISGGIITPDAGSITIPGCDAADDTCRTTLLFYANSCPAVTGSDTILARMSGMTKLLSVMPDSILVSMKASVASLEEQTFRLDDMSVEGDYDITIPLSFDEMTIVYSDTIDGIAEDLDDVLDVVDAIEARLEAQYVSNVQFGVDLEVWAIDSLGNVIPEVTANPLDVPACSGSETVDKPVSFTLTIQPGGAEKLDGLVFSAKCKATDAAVKTGEFILIKDAFLAFDNGIDVNLDEQF